MDLTLGMVNLISFHMCKHTHMCRPQGLRFSHEALWFTEGPLAPIFQGEVESGGPRRICWESLYASWAGSCLVQAVSPDPRGLRANCPYSHSKDMLSVYLMALL